MRSNLRCLLWLLGSCVQDTTEYVDANTAVEQPSAIANACVPPADCLPIVSLINIGVCCSESLRCGFDLSPLAAIAPMYPELAQTLAIEPDKACWPRSKIFLEVPSSESQRIAVEGGTDVLVARTCTTRAFTSVSLHGCCLPDNHCGYDTHVARSTFKALQPAGAAGFQQAECLSAAALNARLEDNGLAAFAHLPAATGECDYAELDAALK